jgi:sec-independent protein translocase protein TatA
MFNIGPPELIIILVLALIIFGPKRLPEIGKTVGKSLKEFRQASSDIRRELREGLNDAPAPGTPGTNGEGTADSAANAENVVSAEGATASHAPATGEGPAAPQEPPAAPPEAAPGA